MNKIKLWFKRIMKKWFRKDSSSTTPKIVIRKRNDAQPSTDSNTQNIPRITIMNDRTSASSNTNRRVESSNSISQGITVRNQRKPRRCPMCATTDNITERLSGRQKWQCTECQHIF